MRITLVNMTLDRRTGGGTAVRTRELALALAGRGEHVTVATGRDGDWRRTVSEMAAVELVGLPVAGGRYRVPHGGFGTLRRAIGGAEVMIALNHWTVINALAWRLARRAGVPFVVCPAGALGVGGRSPTAKRLYDRVVGRRMVAEASGHVAVAGNELERFAAYGVDPADVVVIPNGVTVQPAVDPEASRRRLGVESPLLLFLGRLAPIKGPDLLLEAFLGHREALDGWQLAFAGPDDGLEADLRRRVDAAGAGGRVRFLGFVDAERKRQALAAADLVVIPSRREAMSIVVLEAGAAGRPVLLTDRCGLPEVAEVGGGWVVAASREAIGEGLLAAAGDREELAERGRRWRRHVLARYSWERAAERHLELFRRLVAPREAA